MVAAVKDCKYIDIPNYALNLKFPLPLLDCTSKTYKAEKLTYAPDLTCTKDSKILIVGAGPSGLLLALRLCRLGYKDYITIIEKDQFINVYSRGFIQHGRSLEILEQLNILNDVLQHYKCEVDHDFCLTGYNEGKLKFKVDFPAPSNCKFDFEIGIYQSHLESILARILKDEYNLQIQRGCELLSIEKEKNNTLYSTALIKDVASADIFNINFEYLIGCDGGRSTVRKLTEFKFEGLTLDANFMFAEVELDYENSNIPPNLGSTTSFWNQNEALVWVQPHKNVTLGMMLTDRCAASKLEKEEYIARCNQVMHPYYVKVDKFERYGYANYNERVVEQFNDQNIFLVGDAAHVMSPAGGFGLNLGLQDAFDLGYRLALLLNGAKLSKVAKSYSLERRAQALKYLNISGFIVRSEMTSSDTFNMHKFREEVDNTIYGTGADLQAFRDDIAMTNFQHASEENPMLLTSNRKCLNETANLGKLMPNVKLYDSWNGTKVDLFSLIEGGNMFTLFCYINQNSDCGIEVKLNELLDTINAKYTVLNTANQINPFKLLNSVLIGTSSETYTMNLNTRYYDIFNQYGNKLSDTNFKMKDQDMSDFMVLVRPDGCISTFIDTNFSNFNNWQETIVSYFDQFF